MRLTELHAQHVRSISDARLTLGREFTLITGPNGAGKTNLLEAVHLVATLRPLTTTNAGDVVSRGEKSLTVDGRLEGGVLPLPVRVVVEGGRRRAWVGDKPLRDASAYLGTLATVAFTPDDLQLIKAGPGQRRSFISRAAAELWPAAREELQRYDRCLRQRAAALRRGAAPAVLDALEGPLLSSACAVWRRRERALESVLPHASRWLFQLLGGRVMEVTLQPGLPGAGTFATDGDDARAAALRDALAASLDEDRRRASTSHGPHHDELAVNIDGHDARKYASQGQQRCAALAMTLGVVESVQEARARPPLVLLDDVSSELDEHRRVALFDALAQARCQVVGTATHRELMPLPKGLDAEVFHYTADGGTFTRA
jgi:DNA replication and repair protein RecF